MMLTLNQILDQLQARREDVDAAIRSLSMEDATDEVLVRHFRQHGQVNLYPSAVIAQGAWRVLSARGIKHKAVASMMADQFEEAC